MKCMIIGSNIGESQAFKDTCMEIGKAIAYCNHDLIVCSPYEDSADYWVMKTYFDTYNNHKERQCFLHYPKNNDVILKIADIKNKFSNNINLVEHKSLDNIIFAWLFCQISALEMADYVIAIGGKNDGSAKLLLSLAKAKNKLVIPFSKFDGAAKDFYHETEYLLINLIRCEFLFKKDIVCTEKDVVQIIYQLLNEKKQNIDRGHSLKKVFISYPREKNAEADYLEMILRRKNVLVFRDESDFIPGATIHDEIIQKLNDSNLFISLWCKENACSPWCFDEFDIALNKKERDEMCIIILKLDDTRMIHPRARKLIYYDVKTREDIQNIVNRII